MKARKFEVGCYFTEGNRRVRRVDGTIDMAGLAEAKAWTAKANAEDKALRNQKPGLDLDPIEWFVEEKR